MAYQKLTWTAGDAITKLRMDHIEDGIEAAAREAGLNTTNVSAALTRANEAYNLANTANGTANTNANSISQILSTISLINLLSEHGDQALTAIINATTNANPAYDSLVARFNAITATFGFIKNEANQDVPVYTTSNTVASAVSGVDAIAKNARSRVETVEGILGRAKGSFTDLPERLDDMSSTIDSLHDSLNGISRLYDNARGTYASIEKRFEATELEIETARGSYANLDARIAADESTIANHGTQITTLSTDKINVSAIVNDWNDASTNKVISAARANELKQILSGFSTDIDNTVAARIEQAQTAAQNTAKSYTDGLLGTGFTTTNTVAKAISDLDTSTDNRLDELEAEINAAHSSTTMNTSYLKLDDRLEAIESRTNTTGTTTESIRADLNTIANELSMLDNGAIVDTNTKIDNLEADVLALASEIAMGQDENGRLTGAETRLDTIDADLNTATTGIKARLSAVESTAGTSATDIIGLDTRLDAIDGGATLTGAKTLATRVSEAETAITNLQNEPKSATEIVAALPETGDVNKDYLLGPNEDGKYFYYKWIIDGAENNWKLISGGEGGGTGSSSGIIAATLPELSAADANTDYYIGNNTDGYTHYRYVPSAIEGEDGVFISILPNNLINSISVNTINVTTADALGETAATVQLMSGGITAYNLTHDSNLLANFTALRHVRIKKTYDGETLTKLELIFTDTNGVELAPIEITGGGGASTAYSMRLLGGNTFSIPTSLRDVVNITPRPIVNFGANLAEGIEITATVQYKLSSSNVWQNATIDIPTITNNTAFTLNVAPLLGATGTTTDIRVTIAIYPDGEDNEPLTTNTTYHISRVDMSITALNYNPAAIRTGASFQFNYTCAGIDLLKTVYFKIDNTTVAEADIGTSHNETLTRVIPLTDITTGMHTLQVYFMANGISSNVINTYLICNKDENRTAPIVGLSFNSPEINQGDELIVNYTVYTPGDGIETTDKVMIEAYTLENNVKNIVDSFELTDVRNATVETLPIANYPENENNEPYTLYVNVKAINNDDETLSDNLTASIVIKPFASNYTLTPAGIDNLIYSYTAYGKTNNSADKEHYNYVYTAHDADNTEVTFTTDFNNFNWSTDGYCGRSVTTTNDSGETVTTLVHDALTISGGATVDINVPIFSSTLPNGVSIESDTDSYSDPTQNGRTIELDFIIRSATDLNDVIIDCIGDNNAGFQITPQNCFLVKANPDLSRAVVKDETGAILNEDSIAAAYLSTGIRTHLAFVIEPWAATKAYDLKYHQSVNIYINGEFANACPYNRDNSTGNIVDSFLTNATITIGKPSCIIDLFSIKLYNRGLNHTLILQNYKMAPSTRTERITRFEDNDVIKNNVVDYELARKKFNCLLLVGPNPVWATNELGQRYNSMPTISPYKGSPSPIGRQKNGEIEGKTESGIIFTMPDATSSDGYKEEFRLLDKLRDGGYASSNNVQGTSSQKYPIHNLKVYLAKGDGEPDENGLFAKSKKVKYKLPEVGVKGKESTLCWKADYMSTDHANTFNANVADSLFTDPMSPDWSPDWRDSVQYTVHGIRCLLFQQMGDLAPEFIADGCLNNDKGNSKSYGLEYPTPEDPAEIDPEAEYDVDGTADTVALKWEFTNNSDDLGFFKYDSLFLPIGNDNHLRALDAFESCYPDLGDLEDALNEYKEAHEGAEDPNLNPNYNHLQILSTWVAQRANYWNETDPEIRANKKAIFKNEFTRHFILDHVLVYYLFSEYVALCDNRVKNMFMRSDTIRKEIIKLKDGSTLFEGNSNPNADLFKEFTLIDTGVVDSETGEPVYAYNMKNANQIDWENSTFATWAPVLYDLDSCFGVENVGLLKIPYNAGWQYQQDGSYLFNGHDSVFWLMFEDSFGPEIAAKALTLYNRERGLNYNTFYQEQIVSNQNSIAPAMTNQDMLLKFDVPWATGFMNYSNKPPTYETPEYKYLQRGSRATQKASFISKRSMLLSSKYQSNSFKNDRISMRYGADVAMADAVIKLSGNLIFYPAVSFGDNKGWTLALELDDGTPVINGLVNAGETCRIRATSSAGGQDTLFIAGASVLTDVGDLSIFKAYEINISAAKNLKKIAFGSHAEGYTNARTTAIGGLSSCPLLEEINIENCTNFLSLDLSANGLIKKVYTQGSGVTSVSLPTGGVLNTLELSANTLNITLLNQTYLQNFVYEDSSTNNYSSLRKLWIENTPNVPIVDIINSALGHLSEGVRITGLDINLGTDPTFLETITSNLALGKYINSAGVKSGSSSTPPTITGQVTITTIRKSLYDKVAEMYPGLVINVTAEIIPEFEIIYYDWDEETVLYIDHKTSSERYIDPAKDINNITGTYYIPFPTRDEDLQYRYYFGQYNSSATEYNASTYRRFTGWLKKSTGGESSYLTNEYVSGNTTLVASYRTLELRTYTAEWYAETTDSAPIHSITAEYGTRIGDYLWPDDPNFTVNGVNAQMTRAKLMNNSYYRVFTGWDRPVGTLTENVKIYGQWKNSSITNATETIDFDTLSGADLYALANVSQATRTKLLPSHLNLDVITVPLGQDFNYTTGTTSHLLIDDELVLSGDETEAIVYDGTNGHPNIRPFLPVFNSETGEYERLSFTLAIDFKALLNSTMTNNTEEYVIASCYKQTASTTEGFKIALLNTGTNTRPLVVTWGSGVSSGVYTLIDNVEINSDGNTSAMQLVHSYRNMLVLTYSKETPTLLSIYYSTPSNMPSVYGTGISVATLTWNAPSMDTPLIFGGNYDYTSNPVDIENSTNRVAGAGIIYWAKYWDTDLGGYNCNKLAAWPHEKLHLYMTGYDSATTESSKVILNGTKLTFVTATTLGDRRFNASGITFTDNYASWSDSTLRTFYNNRIYAAFPAEYLSVILSTTISSNSNSVNALLARTITTSSNYLFPPAYREVTGTTEEGYNREANLQWPWLYTTVLGQTGMVYTLSTEYAGSLERKTTVSDIYPFLYRFSHYYITPTTKIFRTGTTNPYKGATNSWTVPNAGTTVKLAGGDIWDTGSAVYVYVTQEDIDKGIIIDMPEAEGGWKAAETWQLRSYTQSQDSVNRWSYFNQVNSVGQIIDGGQTSTSAYGYYKGLVFEFAV